MLLTLLGAQATIGLLLVIVSSSQAGAIVGGVDPNRITAQDLFAVQANTNTITAHFVGLVASIWLLYRISR